MSFSGIILHTKLYIRRVSSILVARPGVLEKLNQALDHSITLVPAPAGYENISILKTQSGDESALLSYTL